MAHPIEGGIGRCNEGDPEKANHGENEKMSCTTFCSHFSRPYSSSVAVM